MDQRPQGGDATAAGEPEEALDILNDVAWFANAQSVLLGSSTGRGMHLCVCSVPWPLSGRSWQMTGTCGWQHLDTGMKPASGSVGGKANRTFTAILCSFTSSLNAIVSDVKARTHDIVGDNAMTTGARNLIFE